MKHSNDFGEFISRRKWVRVRAIPYPCAMMFGTTIPIPIPIHNEIKMKMQCASLVLSYHACALDDFARARKKGVTAVQSCLYHHHHHHHHHHASLPRRHPSINHGGHPNTFIHLAHTHNECPPPYQCIHTNLQVYLSISMILILIQLQIQASCVPFIHCFVPIRLV